MPAAGDLSTARAILLLFDGRTNMRAFIFPGQGSQAVGMGKALAEASPVAREVFQEVDEALGQHLYRLMVEGPADELTLTENAQPAIMANAIATLRVLEKEGGVRLSERPISSRAIRWGNIPRCAPPMRSICRPRRAC